jgi:hypothetical protein
MPMPMSVGAAWRHRNAASETGPRNEVADDGTALHCTALAPRPVYVTGSGSGSTRPCPCPLSTPGLDRLVIANVYTMGFKKTGFPPGDTGHHILYVCTKDKKVCVKRESNPQLNLGRVTCYHYTINAQLHGLEILLYMKLTNCWCTSGEQKGSAVRKQSCWRANQQRHKFPIST